MFIFNQIGADIQRKSKKDKKNKDKGDLPIGSISEA